MCETCIICGKRINHKKRSIRKTCSTSCAQALRVKTLKSKPKKIKKTHKDYWKVYNADRRYDIKRKCTICGDEFTTYRYGNRKTCARKQCVVTSRLKTLGNDNIRRSG